MKKLFIFLFVVIFSCLILVNLNDSKVVPSEGNNIPVLFTKMAYEYLNKRAFESDSYLAKMVKCYYEDEDYEGEEFLEADVVEDVEVKEEPKVEEIIIEENPREYQEDVYNYNYDTKKKKAEKICKKPIRVKSREEIELKKVYIPKPKNIKKKSNVKKVYIYKNYDENIDEEVNEDVVIYKPIKKPIKVFPLDGLEKAEKKGIFKLQIGTFRYLDNAINRKNKAEKLGIPSKIVRLKGFWVVISKHRYSYYNALIGARRLINNGLEAIILRYNF